MAAEDPASVFVGGRPLVAWGVVWSRGEAVGSVRLQHGLTGCIAVLLTSEPAKYEQSKGQVSAF